MDGRWGVQFKRNSAYVAQEDCFVPTMSANETLVFTATLTLPKSVTPEERMQRIEEVLRIMGLWRSRETQVGCCLSRSPTQDVHSSNLHIPSHLQAVRHSGRAWCWRQFGACCSALQLRSHT